jgi:hypothetical protein
MKRLPLLFLVIFTGVLLNTALVMRGHTRLPLLVFLAMFGAAYYILRKMPRSEWEMNWLRKRGQVKTARNLRRYGYIRLVFLAIGLCCFPYRDVPLWVTCLSISIAVAYIWHYFHSAKKINELSPEEWEQRISGSQESPPQP